MFKLLRRALLVAAIVSFGSVNAREVDKITVKGNIRVDAEVIKTYISSFVGKDIDADDINDDLKNLYETGRFEDVDISFLNGHLVIKVKEAPYVNNVTLSKDAIPNIPEEFVFKELPLKERMTYSKESLNESTKILMMILRQAGYYQAKVSPKIQRLEDSRVNVHFDIEKGEQSMIRSISFVGNKKIPSAELKRNIASKEKKYEFFGLTSTYDVHLVGADKENLRRYYLNNGYLDVQVERTVSEMSPDRRSFYITHYLTEGERYKLTDVEYKSQIKDINISKLQEDNELDINEWYSEKEVEAEIDRLTDYLNEKGYAFAEVEKNLVKTKDHTVKLQFNVKPGKKIYVEKIIIEGNYLTRDYVILREMLINEGDVFNKKLLRDSIRNIKNLGFFEPNITPKELRGSAPDKVKLVLTLKEKTAGVFNVGAQLPTTKGFGGELALGHNNLAGTGVAGMFNVKGMISQYFMSSISVSTQRFLGSPLDFSAAGMYNYINSEEKSDTYHHDREFEFKFGLPLVNNDVRANFGYQIKNTNQKPFKEKKVHNLQYGERTEKYTSSSILAGLNFDFRDNRINPLQGFAASFNASFAGLGGDSKYLKFKSAVEQHFRFGKSETSLKLKASGGYIYDFDQYLHMGERFHINKELMRGFTDSGMGPREGKKSYEPSLLGPTSDGTSLGSTRYFVCTAELSFPLYSEYGMRGFVFSDVGNSWGFSKPRTNKVNSVPAWNGDYLRVTAGAGLKLELPFLGSWNVGFVYPIRYNKDHDRGAYLFYSKNIGF